MPLVPPSGNPADMSLRGDCGNGRSAQVGSLMPNWPQPIPMFADASGVHAARHALLQSVSDNCDPNQAWERVSYGGGNQLGLNRYSESVELLLTRSEFERLKTRSASHDTASIRIP